MRAGSAEAGSNRTKRKGNSAAYAFARRTAEEDNGTK